MIENDLIELYCKVDDFFQRFVETKAGKKCLSEYYGTRGPRRQLGVSEVMTLNLVRILDRTGDLKTFHKNACVHYRKYFPRIPNYENFLKATNKAIGFIAAFFQVQLYLNRKKCKENTFYLDSTAISVCENRYISLHKVAKSVASRGKSTKGWFYGFKLQGVCAGDGTLLNICFRPGSEHDSKAFDDVTKGLEGIFVTDAGYLLTEKELEKMYASGRKPCTATRKNMKRLMTKEQYRLLRNRNIIENVWSVLKLNYNLVYHRARSVVGMFRHFFFSISAFLFHRAYEKHNLFLPNTAFCGKLEF